MKKDIYAKNVDLSGSKMEKNMKSNPLCDSEDISLIAVNESLRPSGQQSTGRRGGYGGGMRAGSPRVCKCPNCGYGGGTGEQVHLEYVNAQTADMKQVKPAGYHVETLNIQRVVFRYAEQIK